MSDKARIFVSGVLAGFLEKIKDDYVFTYDDAYPEGGHPVSLLMPPTTRRYLSRGRLHPFFEGLMYEGWLRRLADVPPVEANVTSGLIDYLIKKCAHAIGDVEIAAESATSPPEMKPTIIERDGNATARVARECCLYCQRALPTPGHNGNYHGKCSLLFFGTETRQSSRSARPTSSVWQSIRSPAASPSPAFSRSYRSIIRKAMLISS